MLFRCLILQAFTMIYATQTYLRHNYATFPTLDLPQHLHSSDSFKSESVVSPTEAQALLDLFTALGGIYWNVKWNLNLGPSSWSGVVMDSSARVTAITLENNNLTGTIPSSISKLQSLVYLNLGFNNIYGKIPSSTGNLTNLRCLELNGNKLTGSIPSTVPNLKNLEYLILSENDLTGSVPTNIGALTQLKQLTLGSNSLSGVLPSSLCKAQSLSTLGLKDVNICHPECVESALTTESVLSPRCQDTTDLVLCEMVSIFSSTTAKQFEVESQIISAPFSPFNAPFQTTWTSTSISDTYDLGWTDVSSFKIVFDPWTDRAPTLLTVCTTETAPCKVYVDALPGVGSTPALRLLKTSFFNMTYVSSACTSDTNFGISCWGYQFTVFAEVAKFEGWGCNQPSKRAALLGEGKFKGVYGDIFPTVSYNASFARNRCTWQGVTCDKGQVTQLDLNSLSFSGTIPSNWQYLTSLSSLDLSYNLLYGTVPAVLMTLTSLQTLTLTSNSLTGSLPIATANIQDLRLGFNRFNGTVPASYSLANSSLRYLDISLNSLSGPLPQELCALTGATMYVSGNNLDCLYGCWYNESSLLADVTSGSSDYCQPTMSPVLPPTFVAASSTVTFNYFYLIPIVVGALILAYIVVKYGCTPKHVRVYEAQVRHRKEALALLPLHRAIVERHNPQDVVKLIQTSPSSILLRDYDGMTAWDLALAEETEGSVLLEMLRLLLPVNDDKTSVHPDKHLYAWQDIVQQSKYVDVVDAIIKEFGHLAVELSLATDKEGRPAVTIACPACQSIIKLGTFFLSRFEVLSVDAPYQLTDYSVVHSAIDHKAPGDDKRVALKFMKLQDHYQLEASVRQEAHTSDAFVVPLVAAFDSTTDPIFALELHRQRLSDYPYCVVLPLYDRTLQQVIQSERVSGDWQTIKTCFIQIAAATRHLHGCGFIHGNLTPQSVVRLNQKYVLQDLDSAARIGTTYLSDKFTSAYVPPELLQSTTSSDEVELRVFSPTKGKTTASDGSLRDAYLPKTSHDVWSLGVILYELCAGITLFWQDHNSNIDNENMRDLLNFESDVKSRKVNRISDLMARNLVSQMLTLDPSKRPHLSQILAHPFLSGKSAARLVGDAPEFDVFISYRVRSDEKHAAIIHELLTAGGIKVWWDKKCLEPGLSWEDGFCDGLAKSRIFLPILSRGAINLPSEPRQYFPGLTEGSPCDNVLLEHQLALELRARGLIERIYPVMIGDLIDSSPLASYSSYFGAGCHPSMSGAVVVSAVNRALEMHLDRQCLGSPLMDGLTVARVLAEITKSQGLQIQGPVTSAFDTLLPDVQHMLAGLKVAKASTIASQK